MRLRLCCVALAFLSSVLSMTAQTTSGNAVATTAAAATTAAVETTAQVPRLVRFSGTATDVGGNAPGSVVGVTFSLYAEQSGGAPLWSEVQNVQVDKAGHYTAMLGSSKPDGLPLNLFTAAQAQWLGVRVEAQAEQPRVMLLSVPYALKAADAETFGGKPPSAFMPASGSEANSSANRSGLNKNVKSEHPLGLTGSGTTNYVPLWTNASNLTSSVIYQASSHNVGIGTTSPASALDVLATGIAILGEAGTAAGSFGAQGNSTSSTGAGLAGRATSSSGNTAGVSGGSDSTTGAGVFAIATSTSGANFGVNAFTSSTAGTGVLGKAGSTTGTVYGVHGVTPSSSGVGVFGESTSTTGGPFGVEGTASSSSGIGVDGEATSTTGNAYGVRGVAASSDGVGVIGFANSATGASSGVAGTNASSSGTGVLGKETSASGQVYGVRGSSLSPDGIGAAGVNNAATGFAVGVQGQSNSTGALGVVGLATSSTGETTGVEGHTMSAGGVGVWGIGVSPSTIGTTIHPIGVWGDTGDLSGGAAAVVGTADQAVAVAGYNNATNQATAQFRNETTRADWAVVIGRGVYGSCFFDTSGNVICTGVKSAAVPIDGGSRHVALYAVEAPENWFEDVGSARLSSGSAVVHLEPTFAQTVNSSMEYHVFLTPKGDCKGLYVTNETADSFEVHELAGGRTSIAFDYRIMARRKGYENIRLADKTQVINEVANDTTTAPVAPRAPRKPVSIQDGSPVYPAARTANRIIQQNRPYPATNAQKPAYPVADKK